MRRRLRVWLVIGLALAGCGPKSIEARTRLAERHADEAAEALERAQKAAEALEPGAMADALTDAKEALDDPDINLYPEAGMHQDRYQELSAKLPQVKAAREQRDLEQRLEAARTELVPLVQGLLEASEGLTPASATAEKVGAVEANAKKLKDRVAADQALFAKSADFKDWADNQVRKADKALEVAARAKKGLAYQDGAVAAAVEAKAKRAEAKQAKAPAAKVAALEASRAALATCIQGAAAADQDKELSALAFPVDGKPLTPAKLEKACRDQARALAPELAKAKDAAKKAEAAAKKKEAAEKAKAAAAEKKRLAEEKKKAAAEKAKAAAEEKKRLAEEKKKAAAAKKK